MRLGLAPKGMEVEQVEVTWWRTGELARRSSRPPFLWRSGGVAGLTLFLTITVMTLFTTLLERISLFS